MFYFIFKIIEKQMVKKANLILFSNDVQEKLTKQKYQKNKFNSAVLNHCFTEELYKNQNSKKEKVIAHIGNLSPMRNATNLISAFAELQQEGFLKDYKLEF